MLIRRLTMLFLSLLLVGNSFYSVLGESLYADAPTLNASEASSAPEAPLPDNGSAGTNIEDIKEQVLQGPSGQAQSQIPFESAASVADNVYNTVVDATYGTNVVEEAKAKYIISFTTLADKQNTKTRFIGKNKKKMYKIKKEFRNLPTQVAELTPTELRELQSYPGIKSVELDQKAKLLDIPDAYAEPASLAYEALQGEQLRAAGITGSGIKIALIDSGVSSNHPDLHIAGGTSFLGSSYEDDQGHGTQIAGIINGQLNGFGIKGLAPDAELYAIKVFDSQGNGSYSDIIAAIDWAIDNHMQIINMSFGGQINSEALQNALKEAQNAGILVFAAAGNDGAERIDFPAQYPTAVAVGALDENLTRSSFSNFGDKLELVAPGQNIYTTSLNGAYRSVSGTSFATAFAVASAADVWSSHLEWTAQQVRLSLLNSAESLGEKKDFGYGVINPLAASKEQYGRQVSIDVDGTVSGAVYGDFFAKLSYTNRIPAGGIDAAYPYVLTQGQYQTFSVVTEDAIVDYYTGIFDANNMKIAGEHITPSNGAATIPQGSTIQASWITDATTAPGTYKVKLAPCFINAGGNYGCAEASSIYWYVKVDAPQAPDTIPPAVNPQLSTGPYFVGNSYNLLPRATDNLGVSSVDIQIKYGSQSSNLQNASSVRVTGTNPFAWVPASSGWYSFTVKATDTSGNVSAPITVGPVQVVEDAGPDIDPLTYTVDTGNSPQEYDKLTISANAHDLNQVKSMSLSYKYDSMQQPVLLQTVTNTGTAQQSVSFSPFKADLGMGYYTFIVKAYDESNHVSERSMAIYVNKDTTAPVIDQTSFSISYGSVLEQYKDAVIHIQAADKGTVKRVEYYYQRQQSNGSWGDNIWFASATNSSSSFSKNVTWTPQQYGYYRIVIVAYDQNENASSYVPGISYWVSQEKTAPTTTLTYDTSVAKIVNRDIPLMFTAADKSGISKITIKVYRQDSQDNYDYAHPEVFQLDGSKTSMLYRGYSKGWYEATITAEDYNGNNSVEATAESVIYFYIARPTVVFVPGLMSSELYLGNAKVWPPVDFDSLKFKDIQDHAYYPAQEYLTLKSLLITTALSQAAASLTLKSDGTSLLNIKATKIVRDFAGDTTQGDFIDYLKGNGIDVVEAPYDWRLDLGGTVVQSSIDQAVKEAMSDKYSHGEPISILTHSLGALPTRKYLIDHYNDPSLHVESLLSVAPPSLGSLLSIKGLEEGDDLGTLKSSGVPEVLVPFVNQYFLSKFMHNMTSIYELLPTSKYIYAYSDVPEFGNTYLDYTKISTKGVSEIVANSYPSTMSYIHDNFNAVLYSKAQAFRNQIEGQNINPAISQYRFVGYDADSPTDFIKMIKTTKTSLQVPTPLTPLLSVEDHYKYQMGYGDSVVPYRSAAADLDSNTRQTYYANKYYHMDILYNKHWAGSSLYSDYTQIIYNNRPAEDPNFTNLGNWQFLSKRSQVVTFNCPVTVSVYDDENHFAGFVAGGFFLNDIPGLTYKVLGQTKVVVVPSGLNVHFKVEGYDMGTMDIDFDRYEGETPQTTNLLYDIGVKDGTKLEFDFNPDNPDNHMLNLNYDYEGNGTIQVLHPSATMPFADSINDNEAPVTVASLPTNSWIGESTPIALSANDTQSGVLKTFYQIDDGPLTVYAAPFTIQTQGNHVVSYFSQDNFGHLETEQTLSLRVDTEAPAQPSVTLSTYDWSNSQIVFSVLDGIDAMSGVAKSQYKIGANGEWQDYSSPVPWREEGITTLYSRTVDLVGHIGQEVSIELKIDKTPPEHPVIHPDPISWTQSGSFTVTPGAETLSGIRLSQYKLDEGGEWTDYTSAVTVDQEGIHHIYARTIDYAGNISSTAEALLKIDKTPPSVPQRLKMIAKDATSVTVSWNASEDNLSSVAYDIFVDEQMSGSTSTLTFKAIHLKPNVYHVIEVRARDEAGNLSSTSRRVSILTNNPLVSGSNHTLQVKADGSVWAWGLNTKGQLGNGLVNGIQSTATQVSNLSNIVAVAAGESHSLALQGDGTVWAWGGNSEGALGDGTTTDRAVPMQVVGLPSAVAISAGGTYSLALATDGSVWAWGGKSHSYYDNGLGSLTPIKLTHFGQDNVGVSSSLTAYVVKSDGNVWFWNNGVEQAPIDHVVLVDSSSSHRLALKDDGTVWAWGANEVGQLGNGTASYTPSATPGPVIGLSQITSMTAANRKSIALKSDGTVWEFGVTLSEIVDGVLYYVDGSLPLQKPGIQGSAVAGGNNFVAVVTENSTVQSWGWNDKGQLGDGVGQASSIPVQLKSNAAARVELDGQTNNEAAPELMQVPSARLSWKQLDDYKTTFSTYQVEIRDDLGNLLYDSGQQFEGSDSASRQIMLNTSTLPLNHKLQARVRVSDGLIVSSWSEVKWLKITGTGLGKVAAGTDHTLFVDSTGSVQAWGSNAYGQIGDGTTGSMKKVAVTVPGLASVIQVAAGDGYSLALKTDGTVWAWGQNGQGQLGDGTTINRSAPVQISALHDVAAVSAGKNFSLALLQDGTIRIWGRYVPGSNTLMPQVFSSAGSNNVAISMTDEYGLFLKTDGTVWGNKALADTNIMKLPIDQVRQISASGSKIVALKRDGTVWILDQRVQDIYGFTENPVLVQGLDHVDLVATDGNRHAALRSDGTVWEWGVITSYCAPTACSSGTMVTVPIQRIGVTNIVNLSASRDRVTALKSDGSVWSWGMNDYGQLGNDTAINSSEPVRLTLFLPPQVSLNGLSADRQSPAAFTGVPVINWSQTAVNGGTVFTAFQVQVFNETGDLLLDSGIMAQDTSAGSGSWTLSAIPAQNPVMQVRVRVQNQTGWSAWSSSGWLNITNRKPEVSLETPKGSAAAPTMFTDLFPVVLWNQLDDEQTVFTAYQVQVWNETNTMVLDTGAINGNFTGTTKSWRPSSVLPQSVKLKVMVRVSDGLDWSEWSSPGWMTIKPAIINDFPVVGGSSHSLQLRADGTVWGWGDNSFGQLGTAAVPTQTTAVPITGLSAIAAVSAGGGFSVAVKNDGTVWAWGYNASGELGDGTYANRSVPVQVKDISNNNLTNVISISSGSYHTLALKSDGTVWAWGYNNAGQIGSGNDPGGMFPRAIQVSNLSGIVRIAAGGSHSLALKGDGTVWGWGEGTQGQLGNGNNSSSRVPVQISGISQIKAIAAAPSGSHSLALKTDGTVWAWGSNNFGQLGNNSSVDSRVPIQVTSLANIALVAAGGNYSLALKNDGTVWVWGNNSLGSLGDGTTSHRYTPVPVSGLSNIRSISGGGSHSLALSGAGNLYAWGYNANGQVGNGTVANVFSPVMVKANVAPAVSLISPSGSQAAPTSVSVAKPTVSWSQTDDVGTVFSASQIQILNEAGTTVLVDTTVNQNTTAGTGNWTAAGDLPASQNLQVRVRVNDGSTWSAWSTAAWFKITLALTGGPMLSGGDAHTLQLKADGTVWSWGDNLYGQLGDGTTTAKTRPAQIPNLTSIVAISAGNYHSIALKNDGTVWSWGYNTTGNLGDGTTTNRKTPVMVSGLTNVIAIAASGSHNLALKSDGTLWSWGSNSNGQLGIGASSGYRVVPTQITTLSGVAKIAAGSLHSLAVMNDGTVKVWGDGSYGQLGRGSTSSSSTPVTVTGLSGIVSITAGSYHSVALKNDSTVWTWGQNTYGQLGNGTGVSSSVLPVQATLTGISKIESGALHTLALKNDGTVWAWGYGASGQVGNGTSGYYNIKYAPVQVSTISSIVDFSAGGSFNVASKSDGTLWSWGANDSGQLGDGSKTMRVTPVQIN
ncbi:S8 family serine peptidase [Paenibacillus athensensis]|uniref:Fibronectin type-III domain-containing protein n=1 Tax=Paenibacillus athensensis TaxID=1967502 RepID=A0A4Y8Q8P3_9BACL|nr:S8 family serine peptidase [Paenibacillus athensensis]MCD1260078.1 S8 family serine peptidase [Paenibacillus athensensis]